MSLSASPVAADLALALDPAALLERMGLQPDAWQAEFMRSDARRVLLNIHRQAGKSTVTGALAAHTAMFQPNSLVLLMSPALRQSQELFGKALAAYHSVGGDVPPEAETQVHIELANGSRIISLPGKEGTIRGYSGVRLLVCDEAARIPDELYRAVRPMLAVSGGRLVALTTPFGKRGWFHEAWSGDEAWERYEVPASRCPRISAEFLAEERAALGLWYSQEYECAFLQAEGSLFAYEDIAELTDPALVPLFPVGSQADQSSAHKAPSLF